MHFSLNADHREFFLKKRFIEFEDLFPLDQIDRLQEAIDDTLRRRLKTDSPADVFREGYDLWRDNETIKKFVFKKNLSEIAASLFHTNVLRIAFDQYFSVAADTPPPLKESLTLEELSCIKPLAGALLLRLSDEPTSLPYEQKNCPIPSQKGRIVFLSPQLLIEWKALFLSPPVRLYLVAYAPQKALYHLEKRDPHTHLLKKRGYVFGDSLNSTGHPIIFRK